MATYGKIVESKESEESWAQYIERLEQYFRGNDVEDAGGKKRASLLQPARPAETTIFKKIVETLEMSRTQVLGLC